MNLENVASSCCKAPVRAGLGLGLQGAVTTTICMRCEQTCKPVRVFDALPAPGTFEAPLKPPRVA